MKSIIAFLLIIFHTSEAAFASAKSANEVFLKEKGRDKNKLIAHELIDGEFYFSAIPFINNYLEDNNRIDSELEADIETLVIKTGSIAILNLEDKRLEKFTSPSISLILGTRLFNKEEYKKALDVLNNIPEDHKFSIESALIKGTIKNLERKNIEALVLYDSCMKKAKRSEDELKNEKLKKYYNYLFETCMIRTARLKIEEKKYTEAIEIYDQIDKRSYKWPYVLLDKAWANYYLGDYNRSLCLAVTFKSPLMESYFFPEAEVLTALSYYNLCLWDDSLSVVEHFYDFYQSKALELKDLLGKNKKSETYFLDLYYADAKTREDLNPFIRNLITQTRKQVKFNLDLASLMAAKEELLQLKRLKNKNTFTTNLEQNLDSTISFISKKINFYIKKEIFTFLNEIHKHSYSMFNLKLELLSKKREEIYKPNNVMDDRSRGTAENVKRKKNQYFFDFNGSFWADELGDYSFGLTSKCKTE
jgi:predicted negative regulator of RcsB-dependent stress response